MRKRKTIHSANTLQDNESALKSHLEILKKENQEKMSELEARIDEIQLKLNKNKVSRELNMSNKF